jgi:transcriptional regulator with XRE-family HTH domain
MDLPQRTGPLLRRARYLARMTQQELADEAGVCHSVVSDYERERREPSLSTLRRLVRATGYDLVLSLAEPVGQGGPLTGLRGERIRAHRGQVVTELAEVGLVRPRVVGRVARGTERWHDPVEVLVDRAGERNPGEAWVRGLLAVYTGCEVVVRISDDLDREELAELEEDAVFLT